MAPYAVLFKTHFWSDFTARQLERLKAAAPSADIFVSVDETSGPVGPISHPHVIRLVDKDLIELGLAAASTDKSLLWYNIDYVHYDFYKRHPEYAYYVTAEYDVTAQYNLDSLIDTLSAQGIDYVGSPLENPGLWPWAEFHCGSYGEKLKVALSCFAVFSNRAMAQLFRRRLEMSRDFESGRLEFWPNNEAFIPNEIALAGLRYASLGDFGASGGYNWWPPTHEDDIATLAGEAFLHPVLEGSRYLRSRLRHERHLLSYLNPKSPLRQALARYPRAVSRRAFREEVRHRMRQNIKRRLERLGLRPHWTAAAARRTT